MLLFLFVTIFAVSTSAKTYNSSYSCELHNVFHTYVSDIIAMSWGPVSEEKCSHNPSYQVQYIVNGNVSLTTDSISSGMPMAIIPVGKLKCQNITLRVLIFDKGAPVAESSEYILERNLTNITGLFAKLSTWGIEVTWNPLNLGRICNVTYTLKYRIGNSGIEKTVVHLVQPRYVIPLTENTPCIPHYISVEAISNGLKSPPAEMIYEIGIPPVRNVTFENVEGKVVVDFKPPEQIPTECGEIEYQVIEKDKECYISDFVVVPVSSTGYLGVPTNRTIIKQPGGVQNLEAFPKDNNVYLTWKAPDGGQGCNLVYFVKYNNKSARVYNTHYFAPLELETCKTEIVQIIPAVPNGNQYVGGLSAELELVGDVGAVEEVNCTIKANIIDCWWEKPQNSESCSKILYDVTFFDGDDKNTHRIFDTSFSFRAKTPICSFWINVQPLAYANNNMWRGDVMEAVIDGCSEHSPTNTTHV